MKIKRGKNFTLIDKRSTFIGKDVLIGDNVTIYENNRLDGKCVLKDGCIILPNCHLINTVVGENSVVESSHCEDSNIGADCNVGPFARLRPNTMLGDKVKVGNFVEIKNSKIGRGTKISHLAYVGDCDMGENCNVGCGAIFVNYNGKTKSRSVVGDNCFIGSNCNLIAPVSIESDAYICAGTTVTEDVKSDDFVIGRVRQEVKQNRAHNYLKNKGE